MSSSKKPTQLSKLQTRNYFSDGYLTLKHLNPGGENDVYLAQHQESKTIVVIKAINRDKLQDTEAASYLFQQYDFLSRTQHPNIIRYYDMFVKGEHICIVMEYAEGGDLKSALRKKTFLEQEVKSVFRQLATAVDYLHKKGFSHRRIQLTSILLDKELENVKLADFFAASKMNSKEFIHPGYLINPIYAPPEAIGSSLYRGPEADCWALGVILYTLCFGYMPFKHYEPTQLVIQVCKANLVQPLIKHEAQDLINRLLEPFLSRRFTITDVLEHSWLNDGKNELAFIEAIDLVQEVNDEKRIEEVPVVSAVHQIPSDAEQQAMEDTTSCCELSEGSEASEITYVTSSERMHIRTDVVSDCAVPLPVLRGYRFLAFLGKGTYGRVYLAIHLESNCAVAVKKMNCRHLESKAAVSSTLLEYEILRRTEHPHIIRFYNMFTLMDDIYVIMEYASGGDFGILVEKNLLNEWEEKRVFRQLCTAVYYLHEKGYCHRDLKLNNIMLDEDRNAKLIDFGLITKIASTNYELDEVCGTPFYVAPEVVCTSTYRGPEVDCWSLGVILYRLCYGELPFYGPTYKDIFLAIVKCSPILPNDHHPAQDLIMGLLDPIGQTRYTLVDIFNDKWIDEGFNKPLRVEAMDLMLYAKKSTENPLFCKAHNLPINEVLECSGPVGEEIPVWPHYETPSTMDEQETDSDSQKYKQSDFTLVNSDSGKSPNADSNNKMLWSTDSSDPKTLSFNSTSVSQNETLSFIEDILLNSFNFHSNINLDEPGQPENKLAALEKSGDLTSMNESYGSSGDHHNDLCFTINGNNEEEFIPQSAYNETDAEKETLVLHIGPAFHNNNDLSRSEDDVAQKQNDALHDFESKLAELQKMQEEVDNLIILSKAETKSQQETQEKQSNDASQDPEVSAIANKQLVLNRIEALMSQIKEILDTLPEDQKNESNQSEKVKTEETNSKLMIKSKPNEDVLLAMKSSKPHIEKNKNDKEMTCIKTEKLAAKTKLFMSCDVLHMLKSKEKNEAYLLQTKQLQGNDELSLLRVEEKLPEEFSSSTSGKMNPPRIKSDGEVDQDTSEFDVRDTASFWQEELPPKKRWKFHQFKTSENYTELLPKVPEEGMTAIRKTKKIANSDNATTMNIGKELNCNDASTSNIDKELNCNGASTSNIGKEPALVFGVELNGAKTKSTESDDEESQYCLESSSCDSSLFHLDSD